MKVVQINTVYKKGSTGKIAEQIQSESKANNIDNIVAYRFAEVDSYPNTYAISTWLDCHLHNRIARYTKKAGYYSKFRTKKFLKYLDEECPDIVHIHNIHGSFINMSMLFSYLNERNIKTIWTLHDCWSFTGNCPHYVIYKCEEWKNGCKNCEYHKSIIRKAQSAINWRLKKDLYANMDNLHIVTPSEWLAGEVRKSFLSNQPIKVINNGIDLNIFKPRLSAFRNSRCISNDKFIILGVAYDWGKRKGLDVFIELAKRLPRQNYQIVLVGTDDLVDKQLPDNIISIHRTQNQQELAEIYTEADIFVNPTREEVLGMVNIEALACGTPVLTFRTGGSPEVLDETCGSVVDCDDIDALESEIIRICEEKPYSSDACVIRAKAFDMNEKYREYIELYHEINKQQSV